MSRYRSRGDSGLGGCLAVVLVVIAAVVLSLLTAWATWHLWMWVVPQWFPSASDNVKKPSFWLLYATMWLVGLLAKWVRGLFLNGGKDK